MMMTFMENKDQEMQESYSSLPVLPRLDRLDRLVQLLEEKQHGFSGSEKYPCKNENEEEEDKKFKKTLSSVLDEVQHKGSLLDRLSILENRVLQLSLDMDERNTSKSSSTVAGSETSIGNSWRQQEKDQISPHSIKEEEDSRRIRDSELKGHDSKNTKQNGNNKKQPYRKRLGWLRFGC